MSRYSKRGRLGWFASAQLDNSAHNGPGGTLAILSQQIPCEALVISWHPHHAITASDD